ncbi:MAG: YCF48-related protein [Nitrospirota bacterium]
MIKKHLAKKGIVVFVAMLFSLALIQSSDGSWNGWIYQNPYPTRNTLLSVKFITPQKGWVVGEHGTILYTEDGGESWEAQESGTEEDLKSVIFLNERLGWVVGNGGVLIHTEDGGKKWERQGKIRVDLHNIFFINEKEGWAGGMMGTFLHTKDGGKNWNKEDIGAWSDIANIFFLNPNTGWVLSGGKVYRTKDGGKNWEKSELPPVRLLNGRYIKPTEHGWEGNVYFINDKKGWSTVGLRSIFHTEDGGKTWQVIQVPNSVDRIAFTDEKNGCIAGASIFCTEDGGKTWKERLGAKPGDAAMLDGYRVAIWGLSFANRTIGWAVGAWGGQIFKTEDGGRSWKVKSRKYRWDVYFMDSKTGWSLEYKPNKGSIAKTEDGGNTWKVQKEFDTDIEVIFFFIDSITGWAIGEQKGHGRSGTEILGYFILHTNDGGTTWLTQFQEKAGQKGIFGKPDITKRFFDIFFLSPTMGWVVGSQGIILHTNDGGKNWKQQKSGTKSKLWRVQFVNDKKGWVIGNKVTEGSGTSIILYTEDGGEHWQERWKKETDWMWLMGISLTDEKNGWIMGEIHEYIGTLLFIQTTDGGKTWSEKELTEIFPDEMFFLNKDKGVILTKKGQMLITKDGGKTWDKQRMPIRKYPWHVSEIFKEKDK